MENSVTIISETIQSGSDENSEETVEYKLPMHVSSEDQERHNNLVPRVIDYYAFPEVTKHIVLDIQENKRICLTGHTGTGKTSMITQIAALINQPVIRVNLNGQTTISDFVGFWMAKGGEMVWVDGSLPTALKNGYWLILDEIDYAEPFALSVLNGVLEPDGVLQLKEKGHEIIVPHKDARIFATGNTIGCMSDYRHLYQGTNVMNEAFVDRWRVYLIKYMSEKNEVDVLTKAVPRMVESITERLVKIANMMRESFEKEETNCTFSFRRLLDWTEMMVRTKDPYLAAENTIFSKIQSEDVRIIKEAIQRVTKVKEND